jgi:hypothetical protein
MATKRGWFAILDARGLNVADVLTSAGRSAPADARPEDGFRVAEGDVATVEILGWQIGHVDAWAQAVSKVARRTTISFFLLEGQWGYQVCHRGAVIGGMVGYPLELPALFGNLDKAAGLLGTDPEMLDRYCPGAGKGGGRFPGDRYARSDDRVHLDFARRLGIPPPGKHGRVVAAPATRRKQWHGLSSGPRRPSDRPARADRAPRGASRRCDFDIIVHIVGDRTRLAVAGDPGLREADLDDGAALRRLEARILRRIAGHLDRGSYPHDVIRFRYALDRDSEQRDRLVFGRPIEWSRVPSGVLPFVDLAAPALAEIIQRGFCDPDPEPDPHALDRFVRPCDWLAVLRRSPVRARGFAVSPRRPDYRIEIEGLDGPRAANAEREARALSKAALGLAADFVGHELSTGAPPGASRAARDTAKAAAVRALAAQLETGEIDPLDYVRLG